LSCLTLSFEKIKNVAKVKRKNFFPRILEQISYFIEKKILI